jgi:hypothetical protein
MRFLIAVLVVSLAGLTAAADDKAVKQQKKKAAAEPQVWHMVYFKLKVDSAEARKKLVEACKKLLSDHEGTVHFSAGTRGAKFDRDVNDKDWDVALHLVFANQAAHDKYQDHPRHKQFIDENKDAWAKVRVFDAEVEPAAKKKVTKKAAKAKKADAGKK